MRFPDPTRGLPNRKEVWAWALYDVANQSFTLLINTLLFAVFFVKVVVGDESRGDRLWGVTAGVSMLLAVIASPIVGAVCDALLIKKRVLIGCGMICSIGTCAFALLAPDAMWFAIALYVPANVAYQLGENALASFLPELTDSNRMARISAFSWSLAYAAALAMLIGAGIIMRVAGLEDPGSWRPFFVFAGLWYFALQIPAAVILRDPATCPPLRASIVREGLRRLVRTAREAGRFRQLSRFLLSFFVAGVAVQAVIFFAARIAEDYGYVGSRLVEFLLPVTVSGVIGAAAAGRIATALGNRAAVMVFLCGWMLTTIGLILLPTPKEGKSPGLLFWFAACGMGMCLGGFGTAARSMVGVFTPRSRCAEFFGLWGLTYKAAAVVGVPGFGALRAGVGPKWALGALCLAFVVGALLLRRVDERDGIATAEERAA